ncbi:MAG TPA: DUF2231 domain-containing protein [Actinocrinis sp.]|jgi:hypothetical protein
MPTTVFGLPTHVLIIHVTVVGLPTACLATIAVAFRTKWRQKYGLLVAAFDVIMVGVTYATQLAGQRLYSAAPYLDEIAAQHKKLGQTLVYFVAAVAVLMVLLVLADRFGYAERHVVMVAVSALTIAASAVCLVRVVQVGDSGARAAWGGYKLSGVMSAVHSLLPAAAQLIRH